MECDSAFKAFKDQYRHNNKLCGEMIVKEMGKTTDEFSQNMKIARNDLVYLTHQLNECAVDSEKVELLLDGVEDRIKKNEELIGFKTFIEESGDHIDIHDHE